MSPMRLKYALELTAADRERPQIENVRCKCEPDRYSLQKRTYDRSRNRPCVLLCSDPVKVPIELKVLRILNANKLSNAHGYDAEQLS